MTIEQVKIALTVGSCISGALVWLIVLLASYEKTNEFSNLWWSVFYLFWIIIGIFGLSFGLTWLFTR
jgi:hypothetical protein